MSTKTTQKQKTQQTQTNAPPEWTAQPMQDVAAMVMPALEASRAQPAYTGDFTAQYDPAQLDNTLWAYQKAADASWNASDSFSKNATTLAAKTPEYGGGSAFNPFEIGQGPQLTVLENILGGGAAGAAAGGMASPTAPTYSSATMLDRPDIGSMVPTYSGWTPEAFQADDGGARLDSALSAATQPFVRELMNKILPGIRSSAIESGAYTGDRAMSVLPEQAIADSAGRANEVTQGLAYQGFQSEENRRAQTWQAMQEMLGQESQQHNDFNLGVFGTRTGAENNAYQIAQNALTADASGKNAFGLNLYNTDKDSADSRYGINTQAALSQEQMGQDQYQNWVSNMLKSGGLQNDAFGLNTARGATTFNAGLAANDASRQATMDSLSTRTASGDLSAQVLQMMLAGDQAGIDNALAKYQYGQEQPFQGLDIATQLLAQLSGNYGTQNRDGTSTTTTSTSGLGPIIQGLAGLGMAAGSMGAFGGGLGAVTKFSPISSSLFGGGAQAGMKA